MKKLVPLLSTIFCCIYLSFLSFGQDTLYVKLTNRAIPKEPTRGIYLKSFTLNSDTVVEVKSKKMTIEKERELERILTGKHLIFLDNKNRKIISCYWTIETLFGHLRYFYKNNQVKREGDYFGGSRCGDWVFYSRKGEIRKNKKYPLCNYD